MTSPVEDPVAIDDALGRVWDGRPDARVGIEPSPGRGSAGPAPVEIALDRLAAFLGETTGLVFPGSRRALLRRALGRLLAQRPGVPPGAVVDAIVRSGRHGPAWREIVAETTVGETYFFRHPEQFEVLRRAVVPALVADLGTGPGEPEVGRAGAWVEVGARAEAGSRVEVAPGTTWTPGATCTRLGSHNGDPGSRPPPVLRVWSAGCATGEEAYTLAIVLREAIPPWIAEVRIVGTDVDERAVEVARAGIYRPSAFRVDGPYRRRWFAPVNGGEAIGEEIRALVRFEIHNLVDPLVGRPAVLDGPADLVVCRNVLIYLDPAAAARALERLAAALRPGGWLLLGPADLLPRGRGDLELRWVDGVALLRKVGPGSAFAAGERPDAVGVGPDIGGRPAVRGSIGVRHGGERPAGEGAGTPPSSSPPSMRTSRAGRMRDVTALLGEARRLADAGHLDAARRRVRVALEIDRHAIEAYRLLAEIAEAGGERDLAADAYRRALFLEPNDPGLLLRSALLEWRSGRARTARSRARAAREAAAGRPDEALLDADGLTVGRLRQIAEVILG